MLTALLLNPALEGTLINLRIEKEFAWRFKLRCIQASAAPRTQSLTHGNIEPTSGSREAVCITHMVV